MEKVFYTSLTRLNERKALFYLKGYVKVRPMVEGGWGRNYGWMNERLTFQHFCLDGASQSEAARLELNGKRQEGMNGPGDLEEESSSSRQQAQALAGIILDC